MLPRFFLLILLSFHSIAGPTGTLSATWTNPDTRENGQPFLPGEFQGSRVYYSRGGGTQEFDTVGESIRISGLKKGWWSVYLRSMSHCTVTDDQILATNTCFSDATPTLRVKVR